MTADDLLRTALTTDDELDDIRRAQTWARIETRLAGQGRERARSRWPLALAIGIGAVAVAAVIAVLPGQTPTSFIAPADTRLSLHLDGATRAVLVGPAELEPVAHSATTTVVRIRRGTLLGEFEGGHGRMLQILAPGATIEIVGTLFAVEARADATCVSVSHGTVKLTTAARVQLVTTGQRACSDQIGRSPIAPAMRDELAHHESAAIATAAPATPPAMPRPIITPIVIPPAPVVAPSPPAKPLDAGGLYAEAERALAARDPAAADRALAKLVVEFPATKLLDQAYYDRARIAFDRGVWAEARGDLDQLARLADSPLVEPGAYLRCRVAVAAADGSAAECFAGYRARFPRSPHDRDALAAIVELAFSAGGCAAAKPHIDELAARYPTSAASWSATCR
ncbi:MAG TPA: FecR domain-containing protein [Kofleriaceae bacterium]|jgi:TolA-binding protein|nr:FecR domain-containing protein [Kofleriaceae bacterium]